MFNTDAPGNKQVVGLYTTTLTMRAGGSLWIREEWNRAKWASRRGLLELDLLLVPFVTEAFLELNTLLRQDYRELLLEDDQDLLEWIVGRNAIIEDRFVPVIEEIRRFHRIGA